MRSGLHPDPDHEHPAADLTDIPPLAAQLRTIFEAGFGQLLQDLYAQIDDELFKLSDKADSSALQALYFDAMRQVRRDKTTMLACCLREVLDGDERFWNPAEDPSAPPPAMTPGDPAARGLVLLENDALEIELAVTNAAQKTAFLFHDALGQLELRLAALRAHPAGSLPTHPFAPEALCHAFTASLSGLPVDIRVTLLILKLFDRHVLCKMGPTYRRMNDLLAEHGVLPDASLAPKTKISAMPNQDSTPSGPCSTEQDDEDQLNDLLQLLSLWKRRIGTSPSLSNAQADGKHFDAGEIVNALSLLQQNTRALASDECDTGARIPLPKQSLVDQLAKLLPDGERRRLGQFEEDVIDMVSMIFDFILEDRNLPDPVKALIARLQIPVVKVAIIERSFLAKKTHPLRLLLNALAQAGVGLDSGDKKDLVVLKKIEEVVYRILTEFDEDTRLFAVLLEDFSAFVEHECKGVTTMEERTRQAAVSQERLALAKRAAAVEITARVERQPLPPALVSLLLNAWKDVLVIAYLRREKEPGDWAEAIAIMDRLIAWADSHDATLPQADAGEDEPEVIRSIRDQLDNIAFDPVQMHAFLKDIELWRITRQKLGALPGANLTNQPGGHRGLTGAGAETATLELGDIEEILIHSLEGSQLDPSPPQTVDESFIEQARNLRAGDWVEFCDSPALPFRAKLLLKSQFTSRYVFVNRRGMKLREIGLHELAAGLASNTIRLIAGANEPLLDRALDAVVDTLGRPAVQDHADTPGTS
ncbi:DUF1631 domain-containing protein [Methylococcus mesophilus]|uniref:DUF1631 domain-containing protein n=1 Tax=Methylococcus mesophilus TaxID=2993564 RepID=UPI00224B9D01|nr:DUF1631 domain-containing protein [Methylococcus mesophilus]UZR27657.1 DUF1631 domain-containing protein [Methylococcus mesophilus]